MAEFEEGMLDLIEADAGLGAVIGAGAAMRLDPQPLEAEPTLPAITYRLGSSPREYTLDGGARKVRARYIFDVWGRTYGEAVRVANTLIRAVVDARATLSSGHRVDRVKVDQAFDLGDPDRDFDRRIVETVWSYEEA